MDTSELSYYGANAKFDDPFLMPSSRSMPEHLETALDLCLFLYYLNPQYAQATKRVVGHFITDFDYPGSGDSKEQRELDSYLHSGLLLPSFLNEIGEEWGCFAADTPVVTRGGIFEIKELAGRRVDVLSKDGIYRPADFKSFGVQKLLEVEFSDGRKVFATPEHQWEVLNCSGKPVKLTTMALRKRHRIKRTLASRPERNTEYYEGIRHGFIFGDGSLSSRRKISTALFMGAKDKAMLPYFEGHGNTPRVRRDHKEAIRISGFPAHYKKLPENSCSAAYWYGFVSGLLAADGSVDIHGCALLTQKPRSVLEAVARQLPRLGMAAGPVRGYPITTTLPNGRKHSLVMHYVTLLKQFMLPQDFLIPAHKANFIRHKSATSKYGQFVSIKSVKETGRLEEVFCCVEMATHTFVIGNGVLTGNCYGNAFARMHFPFDRFLVDRRGGRPREYALEFFGRKAKYNWKKLEYEIPDPLKKGAKISLPFRDRPSMDVNRIRLRKLDPRRILIQHNFISGSSHFIWRFETEIIDDVKKGRNYVVNETPMEMLRAISKNQDFAFAPDTIFHFKAPCVSRVSNRGWGLPGVIANYRNIHQLQVYRKIDESVGLDYLLPFRIFSPLTNSAPSDLVNNFVMSRWRQEIKHIIDRRRRDKFAMHSLPFPVEYNEHGASGKELVPKDLIEWQTNSLLDGMGYPKELWQGTMEYQRMPTAIRLFESTFSFIHVGFNQLTQWAVRRLRNYLNQPKIEVQLKRPSIADSLEDKQMIFQLTAQGEISRERGYSGLGIDDVMTDIKNRIKEDSDIQRERAQAQQELQKQIESGTLSAPNDPASQGGGGGSSPTAPGGPPGAGGGQNPTDVANDAQSLAQYWLSIPTDGDRTKAMLATRSQNEGLYAMAKEKMEQMRRGGQSQGRQAVAQQAQQQGPPAGGATPGGGQ